MQFYKNVGLDWTKPDGNGKLFFTTIVRYFCWHSVPRLWIQILLELGVDINAQDDDGRNALHAVVLCIRTHDREHDLRACPELGVLGYSGLLDMAMFLIEAGCDLHAVDQPRIHAVIARRRGDLPARPDRGRVAADPARVRYQPQRRP
ncbi:MAG: hypothetical protein M1833_005076 [Piccolia ochrophora]|nr:MAG: hypothetical protein M1833_005076 [Piccolia ochrophora]